MLLLFNSYWHSSRAFSPRYFRDGTTNFDNRKLFVASANFVREENRHKKLRWNCVYRFIKPGFSGEGAKISNGKCISFTPNWIAYYMCGCISCKQSYVGHREWNIFSCQFNFELFLRSFFPLFKKQNVHYSASWTLSLIVFTKSIDLNIFFCWRKL